MIAKNDYELIENSLFFDFDYYSKHINIPLTSDTDLVNHYLTKGYLLGINPSFSFSTNEYYEANPDVDRYKYNPLLHFEKYGRKEKRLLNIEMKLNYEIIKKSGKFDDNYYTNKYLLEEDTDPVWHYLIYGYSLDFEPNASFKSKVFKAINKIHEDSNPFIYYISNPNKHFFFTVEKKTEYDLISKSDLFDKKFYFDKYKIEKDPVYHYMTTGYKDGNEPSKKFSNEQYIKINEDVDYTNISPLGHWLLYGKKEGRYKNQYDKVYYTIKNSAYFDKDYYLNTLPKNIDPVAHYMKFGCNEGRNPSELFNTREYYALNPDVFLSKINALYHYESTGNEEKRDAKIVKYKNIEFDSLSIDISGYGIFKNENNKRLCIFSSFNCSSIINKSVIFYLKEIQKVVSRIIFVADNPLLKSEIITLKNNTSYFYCKRHGKYDFGSYQIGFQLEKEIYNFKGIDEIIFCNDSMLGPLDGFEKIFYIMGKKVCDFWGLSTFKNPYGKSLQSFFYVFKRNVFLSKIFNDFITSIQEETSRAYVIIKYEYQLTRLLKNNGFSFESYVDMDFCDKCAIPTKHTLILLKDFYFPLIKKKVLTGTSLDDKNEILDFVYKNNKVIYSIMRDEGYVDIVKSYQREKIKSLSDYAVILRSKLFDSEYYTSEYFSFSTTYVDPIDHYLKYGYKERKNPSRDFSTEEYYLINPDVKLANINPLVHYERLGKFENRKYLINSLGNTNKFNKKSIEFEYKVKDISDTSRRAVIFASFSANSIISDYVVYYIKELKKISDIIIFVMDNPILKSEYKKISKYVNWISCRHHGEYDFGSYKIGFNYLKKNTKINKLDEIVFCNDSCIGPVIPLNSIFDKMNRRKLDAWAISLQKGSQNHLQSYFITLKKSVFLDVQFQDFLNSVKKELSSYYVILNYEFGLTKFLDENSFVYDSYLTPGYGDYNPLKHQKDYIKECIPFFKIKALRNIYGTVTKDDLDLIFNYIKDNNKVLYKILANCSIEKKNFEAEKYKKNTFNNKNNLPKKLKEKKRLVCHFYVDRLSMFSARSLFEEMCRDSAFDPYLLIVPDFRFGDKYKQDQLLRTENELKLLYNSKYIKTSWIGKNLNEYIDYTAQADIVVYSSIYNSSHVYYQLRYVSKKCLTICINYGFFRSKYDRFLYSSTNYSMFWKIFLETNYNYKEAKIFSKNKASNCVVVGYSKMDKLNSINCTPHIRKKVLICPHHSLEGGYNSLMHLSNFLRFTDLFLSLPKKYSEIDFIFRPHPMLFQTLRNPKIWGEKKIDQFISNFLSQRNASINESGDYFSLFTESDAMINDCGSYLVEYFYTLKPQCYMLRSESMINDVFVDLGKQCLNRVYKSYNEDDIYNFIDNVVINGKDPLRRERERFAKEKIMINYHNVGYKILKYIKENFYIREC